MSKAIEELKTRLRQIWDKSGVDRLSPRERWMVLGGGVFIVGFFIFQFVWTPYFEERDKIRKSIVTKETDLRIIKELSREHLALKAEEGTIQSRLDSRDKRFTLFTFLDEQSGKAGVKKQIQYMKPSLIEDSDQFNQSVVELKLEKVSLKSLVDFLLLIESEVNVVFIKRISIQESGDSEGYLDSLLQLVTFVPKEQL